MKFYCTAGRGTEGFLGEELKDVFNNRLSQSSMTDGKVFFELTDVKEGAKKILELKIAERAFVEVFSVRSCQLDQRNLLQSMKINLNNKDKWDQSLAVLKTAWPVGKIDSCGHSWEPDRMHKCRSVAEDTDEPVNKKQRLDKEDNPEDVSFRVNFKCPACFRKRLNIKSVPRQIGMYVKHLTGWKVDLRRPQVEICIQLNDEFLTVGLPLTKEPLSKRSFIKLIGLRSTVAHIMTNLLNIQPDDIVLDPMCGKATILLEAAHYFKDARYIGIDKSESQLQLAKENIVFSNVNGIQLIKGDSTDLPFSDGCIDKIVTDAPFGNNHTTDMPLEDFYLKILKEFCRVLTPSGKLVILTSTAMKNFVFKTFTRALSSSSSALSSPPKVVANGDENMIICDNENENDPKNEKNLKFYLNKRPIGDAQNVFTENINKSKSNSNTKENVTGSEVGSTRSMMTEILEDSKPQNSDYVKPCGAIIGEPQRFKKVEDSEVQHLENSKSETMIDKEDAHNSRNKSESDLVRTLNFREMGKTDSDLLNQTVHLNDSINKEINDLDQNTAGTDKKVNNLSCSNTREDTEIDVLDQNGHMDYTKLAAPHKVGVEMKPETNETADDETFKDSETVSESRNNRSKTGSISIETKYAETILKQLVLLDSHYIKLGETHAFICVLEKKSNT